MESLVQDLASLVPQIPNLTSILRFAGIIIGVLFVLSILARLILGAGSILNHGIHALVGILFIYCITILLYALNPIGISEFITPLPYIVFSGAKLFLFQFANTIFPVICSQFLSVIILSFCFHIISDFMPKGIGWMWVLYRLITVVMVMAIYTLVTWLMGFLPSSVVSYAPTVLVLILVAMVMVGALKVILGLALAAINPIIAAIYAFFFSSHIGRKLTASMLTSFSLSAVVLVLNRLGYKSISVSSEILITYIPGMIVILVFWFITGLFL